METIKLAIQKSGRLTDDTLDLLKNCSIKLNRMKGKLKAQAYNYPMELLFLRDDDIPGYVEDGVADIGIVGENVLEEKVKKVAVIEKLGFSKCRLSLAAPRGGNIRSVHDLAGKNIATSYPNLLGNYLKMQGVDAVIHEISGSVEIAPGIGLADAICDLVSSGSTLLSNGLVELETIFKSEAVLVANKNLSVEKKAIIESFQFRVQSVNRAKNAKYILLNAPNDKVEEISQILPGIKSPTVMPLAESGWSSIHSVVDEDKFWEITEKLKAAGAQGLLVVPIEKMVF